MGQYWEVWNLDKHQAISIYKLGEGFLEGISSRLERRYLDRDALWLADLEDLEKVKPDIKKRQSTHDDDYDAALLRAFESARPSKRSKQLENVAGIAGHELACPNAELIKPVPVVPPTAYFSLLSAELIHCINDHIHDYLDVILFALTCRRHWQIGRKHIASRFLSMAYWGGDRIICLGDNCDPFDIPDTLELTDAEKAKLDRWKARRLESDDNADDDPHDNEDDNENDKEEDKEKDNEEETEEDNEGDNEDEDNDEDNEGEDNDEDEDWDDDPESPGSVLYRLLGETVDPLTTSIIEERLSNLQPDWRKPKEFYWLFRTLTTPDFAQKKYGVRIPPARGEECKILRNLSRREYVHSKTLQEFKARYSEEHPGTEVTSELQRVGLSEAVVLRTTWSSDGSCSMSYEEKKDDLHRGVWAGNRFDIVSESTFEKEKEEGWKDVSEEVVSELIAVWECEYA